MKEPSTLVAVKAAADPVVPRKMRAIAVASAGGPEALELVEVDTPVRVGHEVLVRVLAAGVNPVDAKSRAGKGVSAGAAWPLVPGYDFSGIVVQSPYESFPLQPGDEVFGMSAFPRTSGSYAEYVCVPALSVARKPSVLSHAEAAAVPLAALTAWGAVVDLAKAHEGQKMLIHAAAGGVGHLAVQFAAYFGAEVTATASPANADWVLALGATRVIDYTSTKFEDEVSDLDVVIDGVGNLTAHTGSRSLTVLRAGGLLVSLPSAGWPTMMEEAAAAGVRATHYFVQPDAKTLSVIARLITSGDVRVSAETVLPLEDAEHAHQILESGHTRGKIVLQVSDY